jgi:Kef-type K+ transport system membrane component KefB
VNLALLLLQIDVILALCRLLHGILQRMGQPPVIGEIIAGLLLGPSFLGWLAPSWYAQRFPANSLPVLSGLSQIGLVLFMFLVGLRLDLSEVNAFRHAPDKCWSRLAENNLRKWFIGAKIYLVTEGVGSSALQAS